MKNDRLSDALRRGDPADEQPEARTAEARKAALLTRCAAEPFTEPARLPFAAQQNTSRKMRWAFPALAGAGTLTAAALYSAMAWFGASNHASQKVPARMAQTSPRPSSVTPAPRKTAAPTSRPASSKSVIVQAVNPKTPRTRRDTTVADSAPAVRAAKQSVSARRLRQNDALSPAPTQAIVRMNHTASDTGPRLAAVVPKLQVAPRETVEPVVERVIIEQDNTPTETAPIATTVAISINGRAESVIVSRAAEPATN